MCSGRPTGACSARWVGSLSQGWSWKLAREPARQGGMERMRQMVPNA